MPYEKRYLQAVKDRDILYRCLEVLDEQVREIFDLDEDSDSDTVLEQMQFAFNWRDKYRTRLAGLQEDHVILKANSRKSLDLSQEIESKKDLARLEGQAAVGLLRLQKKIGDLAIRTDAGAVAIQLLFRRRQKTINDLSRVEEILKKLSDQGNIRWTNFAELASPLSC